MPLKDHFHPPLDKVRSWAEFHGQWPAMIVLALNRKLPKRYFAGPTVTVGSSMEIDVASFAGEELDSYANETEIGNGVGVATAVWAPAKPTLTVATDLPSQDVSEVLVYDTQHGRKLVAAIELVSPANKDRPENRAIFIAKCAAFLQNRVSVCIVDLITSDTSR